MRLYQSMALGAALATLSVASLSARADGVAPYEDYAAHLRAAQEVAPLTSSEFGDQVSLYNGSTEFNVVDIDVPGNNALPVQLRRRFEVSDRRMNTSWLPGFAEWDLDVPYLEGVFSQQFGWVVGTYSDYSSNRCTRQAAPYTGFQSGGGYQFGPADLIWDGYQMHKPGSGFQDLLVNTQTKLPGITDGTYPWITKDYTRLSCLPALKNAFQGYAGEGFLAVSPDGTKTYFDWAVAESYSQVLSANVFQVMNADGDGRMVKYYAPRSKVYLLASRVEDRFGNSVNYNWGTDASGNNILTSITSSDGRTITPHWTNGVITSATSNVGNWSYGYAPANIGYPGQQSLNTVTRPDLSTWTYTSSGSFYSRPIPPEPGVSPPPPNLCPMSQPEIANGDFTFNVTAPFGANATYQFLYDRHYRNYVPLACLDGNPDHMYPTVYDFVDGFTLESKQVTGPGLTPQNWNYNYHLAGIGGYFSASVPGFPDPSNQTYVPQGNCSGCALSKQVVVTSPTEITKYTFGVQYARNEGRLLGTEVDGLDGTVLRTTTNTFMADSDVASQPFPNYVGTNLASNYKNPMVAWIRPQSQTTIVQDGVTFTNQTNAWDVFARPTSVTRSSTLSTKTETTAYADNTTKWVIGQVASVTDSASGQKIVENTYYPNSAMLASTKSFGLLQKSLTYNAADGTDQAGTLSTIADGLGQTTTLSSWKRGVPRSVTYADNKTESVGVNDSGWITSYTDENNYTTAYDYDPMGRITQVTYPTGDSVAWTPTTSTFTQANTTEFGLPAGHWRQIVSTGAARKTVYFDALLRPLLQREDDTSDASTIRYTEQNFDAANRALFTSYPSATASAYNDLTLGTHATYDGLGRPTKSKQDSELGTLTTSYAYLSGFQTQVTNPRGKVTTTSYQAFDSPDTSHPTTIASPLGVTTNITRDVFGKPLVLTRSGMWNGSPISATRSYVYDINQRLCKRVEPETGATLMDYDGANNIAWTATGSTLTSLTSCNNNNLPANAITHTYDPRNRPLTVTIPGSTNLAYTYFKDGALKTLTSGTGSTANIWTYTYNQRRLPLTEQLSIDNRSETITHDYDALGHESNLTYPDGLAIPTTPNALGQPSRVGPYATGVSYFPNGGMSGFTYHNGIVHTLTQNTRELPQESRDMLGGTAILDDTYTYDENGNVAGIADGTGSNANGRTMAYDALDRLTGTTAPGQPWGTASTTYDVLDNIRTSNVGSRWYDYSYDATNRLSQLSDDHTHMPVMTLGYDANGNVTSKGNGQDSYTFDAANRMQSVVGKESYVYDGYGRRVKVTRLTDGLVDYPVYTMSGQLLTEDDARINKTTDYISLNGSLVAKRSANIGGSTWATTYEHTDALHSPTYETNSSGGLTRVERYTPYGEPGDGTYTQGPGFTGHVTDALTGLTYAQQRYYDPILGRFLSSDPVQASDNGASFNRYDYANNNPYRFTDPDGRSACLGESECAIRKDPWMPLFGAGAQSKPATPPSGPQTLASVVVIGVRPQSLPEVRFPSIPWDGIVDGIMSIGRRWAPLAMIWPTRMDAPACEMPGGPRCGMMSGAHPPGYWPGDKGAEEWGRRNDVGAKEGRGRFHGIKQSDKGKGKDSYGTNPDTGDVVNPEGDVVGNLDEVKSK